MAELNNTQTGKWSETDASNTSPSPDGWPSGTFPNQVEPIGRSTMGAIKRFWDRINGTVTTTGSTNAYVYTPSNVSFPTAYVQGETYTFLANFTNTGASTLNINSLGAKNIFQKGSSGVTALTGGEIQNGDLVTVQYDGTRFQLMSGIAVNNSFTASSVSTLTNKTYDTSGSGNVFKIGGTSITGVTGSGASVLTATLFPKYISGLLPTSIAGTSTTGSLTVTSGSATSSALAAILSLSSGQAWAVSNGNAINGYQGGSTLPNSSTIHFYICNGATGTGVFASTSLTPTLPSGYNTYSQRIFSLNTTASGALIPGVAVETEGGSLVFWLTTQLLDINTSSQGTSLISYTLTVPTGIKVQPIYRASTTSQQTVLFTSGDETDVAPQSPTNIAIGSAPGLDMQYQSNANVVASIGMFADGMLTTNTSGQINARSSSTSVNISLVTRGFKDFRR